MDAQNDAKKADGSDAGGRTRVIVINTNGGRAAILLVLLVVLWVVAGQVWRQRALAANQRSYQVVAAVRDSEQIVPVLALFNKYVVLGPEAHGAIQDYRRAYEALRDADPFTAPYHCWQLTQLQDRLVQLGQRSPPPLEPDRAPPVVERPPAGGETWDGWLPWDFVELWRIDVHISAERWRGNDDSDQPDLGLRITTRGIDDRVMPLTEDAHSAAVELDPPRWLRFGSGLRMELVDRDPLMNDLVAAWQDVTPRVARLTTEDGTWVALYWRSARPSAGEVVTSIEPDSQADRLNLEVGDVIVSYGGHAIDKRGDINKAKPEFADGEAVPMRLWRSDHYTSVTVTNGTIGIGTKSVGD